MAKITFEDKEAIRISLEAAKNKITAENINEIKQSVNSLYDNGAGAVANVFGWAIYSDSVASNQVINTSDSLLTIDGLGANTNTDYKPLGYSGEMWGDNKIIADNVGDAFDMRIDFAIVSKTSNPSRINIKLDIGGGATPSIVIVERSVTVEKTEPFTIDVGFPIYTLDTFVANGGQIFVSTDSGSVTISNRSIFLKRDFSPALQE